MSKEMIGQSIVRKMVTPVITAAGYGKVPAGVPKVLAELSSGTTIIKAQTDAIYAAGMREAIVILNPDSADDVRLHLPEDARVVIQKERKGTAPAVKLALDYAVKRHLMVFFGDMPLWQPETLLDFAKKHVLSGKKMTLMSIPEKNWDEHSNCLRRYGRIAFDRLGNILGIFEPEDTFPDETASIKVNPSMFIFDIKYLHNAIRNITYVTQKGEKTINSALSSFLPHDVGEYILDDHDQAIGVNDEKQLEYARKIFQERKLAMAS